MGQSKYRKQLNKVLVQKNLRACVENNRPVKLSRSAADEALQYKKLVREYTKYHGCSPSDRELCAFLHVDQDKLQIISTGGHDNGWK